MGGIVDGTRVSGTRNGGEVCLKISIVLAD